MSISASISAGVGSITNVPILGEPPINIVAPLVKGESFPGALLDCSYGEWENNPYDFEYQWYRDGVVIFNTGIPTYIVTADDIGTNISCLVIAINAFGKTPQFSNSVYIP